MRSLAGWVVLATAAGCASWRPARMAPALDIGFAAGSRVPTPSDGDGSVSQVTLDAGAVRWWRRGAGITRRYMGVGGVIVGDLRDFDRTDLGADVLFAPPRADRHAGFQFRLGPRLSTADDAASVVFAAEWAHWLIGSLFAEATYDFSSEEGAFFFGARVNLLLPYVLIEVDAYPLD